jgi:hypothetical protein
MLDFNDLEKKEVGFVYFLRKCCGKLEESWYCFLLSRCGPMYNSYLGEPNFDRLA